MIPLNKLINDLIVDISTEGVVSLIELLWNKKNISEFKLADKLGITVNQVRNMLYKLHSYNLVESIRKKDKKKGWYIYYWTFNLQRALILLISLKKEKIAFLGGRLKQKQVGNYFICPNKCVTLKYDTAMDCEFRCSECGSMLERLDMKKQVSIIKKKINVLKEELEAGKNYLENEIKRIEKKKARLEKKAVKKRPRRRKRKAKKKRKKVKKKPKKKKIKKKAKKPKKIKKRKIKKKFKKRPKKRKIKKKIKKKAKKPKKIKKKLRKIARIKWR